LAALTLAALASPLPARWENWRYSRPLELPAVESPRLARVAVPPEVYPHAQRGLLDARVVDDRGDEVPFLFRIRAGRFAREFRDARLLETSFRAGEYTQAFVDTGETRPVHNSLELETSERDFFVWVELAVSEDLKTWRVLRERVPLYRFEKEGLSGNLEIEYPESVSRYLRLRVLEKDKAFSLTSARVAKEIREEPELVGLPVTLTPEPAAPTGQSWWGADLGADTVPVSGVRFEVPQAEFHRAAQFSVSLDGQRWHALESGAIYRYRLRSAEGDRPQERLEVRFGAVYWRHWRVAVFNRNDPPLSGLQVQFLGTPTWLVFRQEPGRSYRLLYGHPRAALAIYEFQRLTDVAAADAVPAGTVGAEEENSAWDDPAPWTERNPWVLWAALGVAVLVLGFLAVRTLRTPA
jgi:hypothetical protein